MAELSANGLPEEPGNIEQFGPQYKVAFDEARQAFTNQKNELDGIRTRAVAFMAFVGTATAFLAGTTVKSAAPSYGFYLLSIIATCAIVGAAIQLVRVIRPKLEFTFRMSGSWIITRLIEPSGSPKLSMAQLHRELAGWCDHYAEANESNLAKIRKRYASLIILGIIGLGLWALSVWLFGRVGIIG